ncbi:TonB-dependent receptor family protein [Aquimonas voraii]|uniref:Fe(3+) dicitrate transport protein n=1 Tax=Aquimonas voraii TaxID=265719 RepID=A0A1G6UDA4_9GAMM|nr:TonB-dependent receptor [Aquimonas voraii]SDD38555.1 Fe(3+) dicitrate transport protein [Aquimonas voraii]
MPLVSRPHPLSLALGLILSSASACSLADASAKANADAAEAKRTLATIQVVEKNLSGEPAEGSSTILDQSVLVSGRALTVNEALRKVPGVTVRDEEGFGLRPNIGIRGSNPTRSTKVLLLEDGLPAMYAPYGDNASYYHAPIQRYDRIEVLKGAGLLRFGPQTITGAINYITPDPPQDPAGHVQIATGTRGYTAAHASVGGKGLLFDLGHKQGDGARDNTALEQSDLFAKYSREIGDSHALTLRANHLREESQVGYSGITDAEYASFGAEYYPFLDDLFDIEHSALSLSHAFSPAEGIQLLSSLYYSSFDRGWWRQSSTTSDTQCGTAFRDARYRGERVDPRTCNSAQGRVRSYDTWGFDTRLSLPRSLFGTQGSTEFGLRWHEEEQDRLQINGTAPAARSGTLAESNFRTTEALSGFLTSTFDFGALQLTPSLRREDIDFSRRNRLPGGAFGEDSVRETLWGLGLNYELASGTTLYASAHEGFAPPRVEDLIAGNGTSTDVDAESSTNLELGLRSRVGRIDLEATAFHSDFDNQIAVGSIAGGSTPLAQGETEYAGLELAVGLNRQALQSRGGEFYANAAVTWLATAEQSSVLRRVDNGQAANGSAAGNRLPYAPEFTFTGRVGYARGPWDLNLELQHVGRQWADFANRRLPAVNGDGQFGQLDSHAVWSATLNYEPEIYGWSGFLAVKNLTDEEYIVDRTRGILFGNPRQIVVGARYAW